MSELWQTMMTSDVVHRLGWVLLHSIWVGAAVALLLAASQFILRRQSANARYLAGCAAMLAMVGVSASSWFFIPAFKNQSPEANAVKAPGPMVAPPGSSHSVADAKPIPSTPPNTSGPVSAVPWARFLRNTDPALPWLVGLWALGVLTLASWQLCGWNATYRIRRRSPHLRDESIRELLAKLANRFSIRTPVDVLESMSVRVPALIGWWRPAILLPMGLVSGLPTSQLEAILVHELAHVRRHDYLVNLLQSLVETLFFYHPAVWYISARMRVERENCCDDLAVKFGAEPLAYAESLLCVARRALTIRGVAIASPAMMLGATGKISALRRRVRRLLGATEPAARESWPAAVLLIGALAAAVLVYACKAADPASGDGAPAQPQESPKPKQGAKLDPDLEKRLVWGEPVNGLRAALVIRSLPDEPGAGDMPDLYLLVQNVSDAPIHLNDTTAAPGLRYLTFLHDDVPQGRTRIDVPTMTDAMLQPREATFLLMCPRGATRSRGQNLAAGMLKDAHMILFGQLNIEKAPPGAWTGKLVSGYTNAATAQIGPPQEPKASPAAAEKPAAAPTSEKPKTSESTSPQPKAGAKLQPGVQKPKEGAQSPKLAERVYPKSGVPLDEQAWPMPPWGVEKDGLSSGIRVVPVETHIGGEVKVELWVRNSGTEDVKFNLCPRTDIGLRVTARDSNGADHTADITSFDAYPVFFPLMLPPGHIVKVKEFTLRFDAPGSDAPPARVARFLLPRGSYKLRTKWSDAHSHAAREGEWTGEIESGSVDLKVAAADAAATPAKQPIVAAETARSGGAVQPKPEAAQLPGAPKRGATLELAAEKSLKWGEAVNGLRAAIVMRSSSDTPKAGDLPDLYLAVQNVSDALIRLTDTDVPANVNLRELSHKKDSRIVYVVGAREPALGDLKLQPREVAFLPMFDPDSKMKSPADPTVDGHTLGQIIAEGVLKNTHESLVAQIQIEKAPPGAWTGKLVTAETSGSVAVGELQPKD